MRSIFVDIEQKLSGKEIRSGLNCECPEQTRAVNRRAERANDGAADAERAQKEHQQKQGNAQPVIGCGSPNAVRR